MNAILTALAVVGSCGPFLVVFRFVPFEYAFWVYWGGAALAATAALILGRREI